MDEKLRILEFSDLLNQIDGIVASEGRLLIMTTNYPENLDAALVRPGRCDRRWHIGYARVQELLRFYQRARENGARPMPPDLYLDALGDRPTIAAAQVLVLSSPQAEEAVTR